MTDTDPTDPTGEATMECMVCGEIIGLPIGTKEEAFAFARNHVSRCMVSQMLDSLSPEELLALELRLDEAEARTKAEES